MRDLLVSKNLKLRYDDDATRMQEPPSAEELEEYRGNPEAGPRRSNLKIDWHSSLASRWNRGSTVCRRRMSRTLRKHSRVPTSVYNLIDAVDNAYTNEIVQIAEKRSVGEGHDWLKVHDLP